MDINWGVRLKNKTWWLAVIPAILLLIQAIAAPFGYTLDFEVLGVQLAGIVNALFAVLALMGIVADPTTEGIEDSDLAMTYTEPKPKGF